MKPLGEFEVWFLTGSQGLYGEETLDQVARNAAQVAAALNDALGIPVRVRSRPVLTSPEAIAAACQEANATDACVGLVAWMHTFSPARMWIAGLSALRKPLLHLHTQFNRDLPWAQIDMDFMNLNQAAHGDREFGYLETRLRLARTTVVGHWSDPVVADRIGSWSRAACAWREAHHLRVARFGDNMRDVAVTEGDKVEAQIRLGVTVNGYGVGDLVEAIRDVPDREIDAVVGVYDAAYELAPELRAGGARRESLCEAARIEVGLRAFLDTGGFAAFTDTFEDLGGLRQLPGIAVQRLMADGYGFGAEGDWKSAVLVRLAKVMATGLPGGTSFMEDYTYDLGPDGPTVLGAHMLEVCPSIADGQVRAEIHPLSIGARSDPVRLVFDAAPGPALVASLVDLGDRFRIVANAIEVVPPTQPLPRLPVARALWRPRPDYRTAVTGWLVAGGAHHTVLSRALDAEPWADLADMAGLEFVLIDDSTSLAALTRELRWNQAYYRLAGGL
ncbi:MAG TPA: L-arabinose isomerase [Candidatus Limnocylindrales bacterium]